MAKNTLPCSSLTKIIWLYTCQVIFFTPDCSSVFHNCTMYTMYFWMHTKRKKKPNYHHWINKTSLICVLLILMNRIIDTRKKNLKKNFQLENKNLCWNDRQTRIKVWIKTNIFLTYTTDDLNMSVDIPVRIPFHKWKDLNTDRLWAPHQPFWARY